MKCRIMTLVPVKGFPAAGEQRSIPAEISGTGPSLGSSRSPTAREHPVEPSISASPMEPAQEPDQNSIPVTVSLI
jgi:hypothetical protein